MSARALARGATPLNPRKSPQFSARGATPLNPRKSPQFSARGATPLNPRKSSNRRIRDDARDGLFAAVISLAGSIGVTGALWLVLRWLG
jgi:hypothetical protein